MFIFFPASSLFPEIGHKTVLWKVPFLYQEKGRLLSQERGKSEAKKYIQTNLVKPTYDPLVTSWPLCTQSPNPFVLSILHRHIASLSKRHKKRLWVFILLGRLPCTHGNSVKGVCFPLVHLSSVSLRLRPSQRPKEDRGEIFPPWHHNKNI